MSTPVAPGNASPERPEGRGKAVETVCKEATVTIVTRLSENGKSGDYEIWLVVLLQFLLFFQRKQKKRKQSQRLKDLLSALLQFLLFVFKENKVKD